MGLLTLLITGSSYSWVPGIVRVGGQKRKEQGFWKEHWSGSQEISVLIPFLSSNICMILGSQFPSLSISNLIYELIMSNISSISKVPLCGCFSSSIC